MLSCRLRTVLALGLAAVLAGGCTSQTVQREPDEQAGAERGF